MAAPVRKTRLASVWIVGVLAGIGLAARARAANRTIERERASHSEAIGGLNAELLALRRKVARAEHDLVLVQEGWQNDRVLLDTIVETAPCLIYAKDRSGRYILANTATLGVIAKPWEDVVGRDDSELLPDAAQGAIITENDRRVMCEGGVRDLEETVNDSRSGGMRQWLSNKMPLHDASGVVCGMVGVSLDITERKRAEAETVHASRVSAMGEMAAALAHELNQPLGAITLFLDGGRILLSNDHPESPVLDLMERAREQALRAGKIIRRLRAFVSRGESVRQLESLATLIDEACDLALLGSRESGVTTIIEHAEAATEVFVDRVQIQQVVVNLVRNAIEAMAGSTNRTLGVRTWRSVLGDAVVTVEDSGPGMAPNVLERVFEPFFSTKGAKGMGIGLSVCRTIVEAHRGTIQARSTLGGGAVFTVTLPVAADAPAG